MKKINFSKPIILILLMVCLVFSGSVCVFAETEAYEETYAIESFVEETTEEYYEEDTTEYAETEIDTEDVTETESETSEPSTTRPEPTYPEPLPEVEDTEIVIPPVIGDAKEENEPVLFWGFFAWICIGVGIAVILAVLLTTKTRAYRSGGRKRYSTGDKISGKKRLLDDQYYNNRKRK